MKEKIFSALKTACGNTTSISDKTLEKMAETMAVTIKEESQIEAAIEAQKPILQAIDGNINHIASEAVKKVKTENPDKTGDDHKKVGRPKKDSDDDDEKIPKWAEKFLADQNEIKQKVEAQLQEKTLTALSEKVKAHEKLKDIPASYLKGRNLVPKTEEEIDQLVTQIETDYNGFKQEMAEKGVVISVPPTGGGAANEKSNIDEYLAEKFPKEERVLTK